MYRQERRGMEKQANDPEVIARVLGGDSQSYGELVERYQRLVYAIAWSRLGDAELCEDVAQETFLCAYRYLGALRDRQRFGSWLARLARSMANRAARTRERQARSAEQWAFTRPQVSVPPAAVGTPPQEVVENALGRALAELTDRERECLTLFYVQQQSIRQAATLSGTSESAFKVRLHRARQALRQHMEPLLEEQLHALAPRKELRTRVMSALPLVGKLKLPSLLPAAGIFFAAIPFLVSVGIVWYDHKRLVRSYGQGGDFRAHVQTKNRLGGFLYVALLLLAVFIGQRSGISQQAGFQLVSLYFGAIVAYMLAVRPFLASDAARYNAAAMLCMLIGALCVGFLGASHNVFRMFMQAGAVMVILAALKMPAIQTPRADYSLFLRAAKGLLGRTPTELDMQPEPQSATPDQVRDFAAFLTQKGLVQDAGPWRAPYALYLSQAIGSLTSMLLLIPPRFLSTSAAVLDEEGHWHARLSGTEARQLERLAPEFDARQLELQVTYALRRAFDHFLRGEFAEAQDILEPQKDSEVFKRPYVPLFLNRKWVRIMIILSAVSIVLRALAIAFSGK